MEKWRQKESIHCPQATSAILSALQVWYYLC